MINDIDDAWTRTRYRPNIHFHVSLDLGRNPWRSRLDSTALRFHAFMMEMRLRSNLGSYRQSWPSLTDYDIDILTESFEFSGIEQGYCAIDQEEFRHGDICRRIKKVRTGPARMPTNL